MSSAKGALQGSRSRIHLCTRACGPGPPLWKKQVQCVLMRLSPAWTGACPGYRAQSPGGLPAATGGPCCLKLRWAPFPPRSRRGLTCGSGLPILSLASRFLFDCLLVLWRGEPDSEQAWRREVWGPVTSKVPVNVGGPVWLTGAILFLV